MHVGTKCFGKAEESGACSAAPVISTIMISPQQSEQPPQPHPLNVQPLQFEPLRLSSCSCAHGWNSWYKRAHLDCWACGSQQLQQFKPSELSEMGFGWWGAFVSSGCQHVSQLRSLKKKLQQPRLQMRQFQKLQQWNIQTHMHAAASLTICISMKALSLRQ